jgi:hypothetical protein
MEFLHWIFKIGVLYAILSIFFQCLATHKRPSRKPIDEIEIDY